MCFPGVIRLFCFLDKTQQKLIVPKPAHCHNMFKQNFGAEFRELLRSQRQVTSALFWAPDQWGHQKEVHQPRRVRQLWKTTPTRCTEVWPPCYRNIRKWDEGHNVSRGTVVCRWSVDGYWHLHGNLIFGPGCKLSIFVCQFISGLLVLFHQIWGYHIRQSPWYLSDQPRWPDHSKWYWLI